VRTRPDHPTLEDVARLAGVSRATAARALTGSGPVRAETREHVLRAASDLAYVAHHAARALAAGSGTRLVVAAVTTRHSLTVDPYLARVVAAAAAECSPEGIGVGLQAVRWDDGASLTSLVRDRDVVGVVVTNGHRRLLEGLDPRLGGRVVSIGVGSEHVPVVDVDGADLAARMTQHLLDSGRRRIAMIGGPIHVSCTTRPIDGHVAALAQAGLPARVIRAGFTTSSGRTAALRVLALWPDVDAVLVNCDDAAVGVLETLTAHGVDVPGDVAVTGFDDLPLASYAGLTSATHPVEDIAAAAARTILDNATEEDRWFTSELVLRRTG
jgi:DNA-binding LacI/PurR family transcriptional regulator